MGYFFRGFQCGSDTCFARATVSCPGGVLLLMVDPAPMYEPLAIVTGATSVASEPMNESSSITVRFLFVPS
jgi:hypothetical protein